MSVGSTDPRYDELMRRRAAKNGTLPEPAVESVTDPEPPSVRRKLDDAEKDVVRDIAEEHPGWSTSDIADQFESVYGWRPSGQGIGRALAEPAPRDPGRPGKAPVAPAVAGSLASVALAVSLPPEGPDAEPAAIVAVSRALTGLSPAACRRVIDWASARFVCLTTKGA